MRRSAFSIPGLENVSMKRNPLCWSLSALILIAGCGSSGGPTVPPPPAGADAGGPAAKGAAMEKGKGGGAARKGATATLND